MQQVTLHFDRLEDKKIVTGKKDKNIYMILFTLSTSD